MKTFRLIAVFASVALGFLAALAWWWSSRVYAPAGAGTHGVGALLGGDLIGEDARGRRYDVIATAALQSRWNGIGALLTASAVLLQGAALLVSD